MVDSSKIGTESDMYFAADEAEMTVSYLERKSQDWWDTLLHNTYLDKMKRSWNSYFGVYYEDNHSISFSGETGELVQIAINHFRNIAMNMLTMTTATRPAFQAKSTNTDYKSRVQTTLANGLLQYYMRDKRLENRLKTAVEYAIVMGSGYIKMEWNSTSGEIFDRLDPEPVFEDGIQLQRDNDNNYKTDKDGEYLDIDGNIVKPLMNEDGELTDKNGVVLESIPIYEGDVEFENLSPFDVVFDTSKEDPSNHQWVLTRTFKNKFDLAAKYPEKADEIRRLATKSDRDKTRLSLSKLDETFDVPVYEFFHKKSESLPNGRYVLYLNKDIILLDTPIPYRRLPVFRISPSDILGTSFGYTILFDLLPIQDAVNSLYSTVLTNQNAFGVQNVLNPQGNDVKVTQVSGGLNWIEYNPQAPGGGKPEPLNLTNTPPEIFNFMQILIRDMETISGINSVARGNPESQLRSGNALALVQSQALQFISGLQQSYIQLIEDVGTGLIELLQDFAMVPRIVEITGKSNKSYMKEFKSDDLDTINRVTVDVGNALANTTAGRIQMAENLIQMGVIKSPEQFFSIIETGSLDAMTEGQHQELLLIKQENEKLVEGSTQVIATAVDAHALHIREHKNVLADPDLRLDPNLVERTLTHINEHIRLLQETDPNLLSIIQEQPLSPPGGTPVNPNTVAPNTNQPDQDLSGLLNTPLTGGPEAQGISLPKPAQPPLDPATGLPLVATERPIG